MMRKLLLIFTVMFILQTCNENSDFKKEEIEEVKDVKEVKQNENNDLEYSESPVSLDGIDAVFSKDLQYGPYDENTFDIFIPKSDKPTPLVIYIHGGYFTSGDKTDAYTNAWDTEWDTPNLIQELLINNIAVANINYRLLLEDGDKEGVLKSMTDSKRCLQYIRYISDVLNIDKESILLSGRSAGAGTSLWLAFSDEMADPENFDPVLRESTRVKGVAVRATQSTYDLQRYQSDVFKEFDFSWIEYLRNNPELIPLFRSFYGINHLESYYSDRVINYRKKVDILELMSADDPEFWASNPLAPITAMPINRDVLTHHALHVKTIKQWGDSIGIPSVVYYDGYDDPTGEGFQQFIIRKLQED